MDLLERARYLAWLRAGGLDDLTKHMPGGHDQLKHGRRGGQPGRGERRRKTLASITADYQRARGKVSPERKAKGEARIAGMQDRAAKRTLRSMSVEAPAKRYLDDPDLHRPTRPSYGKDRKEVERAIGQVLPKAVVSLGTKITPEQANATAEAIDHVARMFPEVADAMALVGTGGGGGGKDTIAFATFNYGMPEHKQKINAARAERGVSRKVRASNGNDETAPPGLSLQVKFGAIAAMVESHQKYAAQGEGYQKALARTTREGLVMYRTPSGFDDAAVLTKVTVYHEMGHLLHKLAEWRHAGNDGAGPAEGAYNDRVRAGNNVAMSMMVTPFLDAGLKEAKAMGAGRPYSKYSLADKREWFAENFAAWMMGMESGKDWHPDTPDYVQRMVRMIGGDRTAREAKA